MRLFQCSVILAVTYVAYAQKDDKDDDKFSIGLGVLAPSYRQKVGTGKELGAQIDFNQEGKGFSYTVSQGDPNSGKPYTSIQISRPAPQESPADAAKAPAPASYQPPPQYAAPAPRYTAPAAAPAAPQYQAPPPQYAAPAPQPQYAAPAPQPQYAAPAPQPQYAAPAPQYSAPSVPQYSAPSAASQYSPPSAPQYSSGPVQYAPQYTPSSSPGVQYAQPSPRYVSEPQYAPAAPQYAPAAPQYRPSSISYQPQPQAPLPQVAPQPFGGSSAQSEPRYIPRYQSQPAPQQAYPSSLAAPETYNAPASGEQAAPQYIPSIQNVKYQFGSGAEPAFASQLSIFSNQRQ